MWRIAVVVFAISCQGSSSSPPSSSAPSAPSPSPSPSIKDKVVNAGKKVDKALDSLDSGEAADHLAAAKDAIGKGGDAVPDCDWVQHAIETDATATAIKELHALCAVDVPLGRATKAVAAVEKAKQEQPGAPSYTECSSDSWAKASKQLAASTDPRWTDLQTRWKKACPDVP